MAFLRLDRRKLAAVKGKARKRDLQTEADAWIEQRKAAMRSRSVELLGRTFATKRKAAEFGKRLVEGNFHDGKPREARSFRSTGKASMAVDKPTSGAGDCYRVRQVNGIWRRYVQASSEGGGWRWVSDHAEMDAALAGRNPLNEPE